MTNPNQPLKCPICTCFPPNQVHAVQVHGNVTDAQMDEIVLKLKARGIL